MKVVKLRVVKDTYSKSEVQAIEIRNRELTINGHAEQFFMLDERVVDCAYIDFMHPIYRKVHERRLKELGIPKKRNIYATKWASIAAKIKDKK